MPSGPDRAAIRATPPQSHQIKSPKKEFEQTANFPRRGNTNVSKLKHLSNEQRFPSRDTRGFETRNSECGSGQRPTLMRVAHTDQLNDASQIQTSTLQAPPKTPKFPVRSWRGPRAFPTQAGEQFGRGSVHYRYLILPSTHPTSARQE